MANIEVKTEKLDESEQNLNIANAKKDITSDHRQTNLRLCLKPPAPPPQKATNSKIEMTKTKTNFISKAGPQNQHYTKSIRSFLPGARCGEIFVAKNARRWTFNCTFCNKSTRDIGDFICHIKIRHLSDSSDQSKGNYCDDDEVGSDDDDDYYDMEQDVSNYYPISISSANKNSNFRFKCNSSVEIIPISKSPSTNETDGKSSVYRESHQQLPPNLRFERATALSPSFSANEYLDCGNFLDVNVHTENEELSFNGQQQQQQQQQQQHFRKPHGKRKLIAPKNPIGKKSNRKKIPSTTVDEVVEINDDDDDVDNEEIITSTIINGGKGDVARNDNDIGMAHHSKSHDISDEENLLVPLKKKTISDDRENYDESNDHLSPDSIDDGADTHPDFGSFLRGEEEEDYDNQLLMPFSDANASGEGKSKRRPIRGTAYCALCNRTFQYYSLYRNHMIKHSNETPFKCPVCKKGFKSKQAIRYHMNTHQRVKTFKCSVCDMGYYTENQFIAHVLTHENDTIFPCLVCGEILNSEKEREAHLSAHTEERPFRCEYCHKLFRLRHHLSNHLKMHRQYRCDYCKKEFPSAVHLRKPYACNECENLPEVKKVQTEQTARDANKPKQSTEFIDLNAINANGSGDDEGGNDSADDMKDDSSDSLLVPQQSIDISPSDVSSSSKKRLQCKYCPRSYSHMSGLNFHIRNKHC